MSALGQKRTFSEVCVMSALPPKAEIAGRQFNVRFVPKQTRALQQTFRYRVRSYWRVQLPPPLQVGDPLFVSAMRR